MVDVIHINRLDRNNFKFKTQAACDLKTVKSAQQKKCKFYIFYYQQYAHKVIFISSYDHTA